MTEDAFFYGLIAIASILTYFSFRTTFVLIRIGAGAGWTALLLYIMSGDHTLTFSNPWCVALFMTVLCAVTGILLLYAGRTIDKGDIVAKKKDTRTRSQLVQDNYKEQLRGKKK
jgi:hypothetical protein